jgi:thioredoxin
VSVPCCESNVYNNQVLQSELPVLVDYWAEWCAPCKAMAPVLDEVAEEYRDRLRVLNVKFEPQIQRPTHYSQFPDYLKAKDS